MASLNVTSPYADGILTADHETQIVAIRTCLQKWLLAASDARKKVTGAKERLNAATQALADLQVDQEYAFTPSPPYKFRRVFLSCIRCYWLALVASLGPDGRNELAMRVDCTPPFGDRIPKFDGKKCVEKAGELSEKEYEGLMRTIPIVVIGMVPGEVQKTWRELAEVGVQTWEEQD